MVYYRSSVIIIGPLGNVVCLFKKAGFQTSSVIIVVCWQIERLWNAKQVAAEREIGTRQSVDVLWFKPESLNGQPKQRIRADLI